jgi:hypothetical protein
MLAVEQFNQDCERAGITKPFPLPPPEEIADDVEQADCD